MDHDAVADSHLPVLIRAGGEAPPCASPPVIGPLLSGWLLALLKYPPWETTGLSSPRSPPDGVRSRKRAGIMAE
jgi:hypothetical protein